MDRLTLTLFGGFDLRRAVSIPSVLLVEGDVLALNENRVQVDVLEFECLEPHQSRQAKVGRATANRIGVDSRGHERLQIICGRRPLETSA
jgi:hypothetical protein